jgi:predicted dehydrogenase
MSAGFRLGFFGAGLIARYHARSLRAAAVDAPIVSVYDPDHERSETLAGEVGARAVPDEAEVFEGVDGVYICTWTSEHPRLVAEAAARGLAVFCEKPLATTLADAESMTAAVTLAGVTNQVGLVLRSSPGFALLRSLVADPAAGRVVSVVFRDDQEIPLGGYYGSTWRGDAARAGAGTLLEHSIHDLDMLEHLVGPLTRLSAHQGNLHGHPGIEDSVAVSFGLAGGGTGVLTSVWHDVPGRLSHRSLEIFCERVRFWAAGNMAETVGWEWRAGSAEEVSGADRAAALAQRGWVAPANADAEFVAAAAAGRPATPDFAVALRAHVLADAAYRSAASGGAAVPLAG